MSEAAKTPGYALWNLDRPLSDYPNRKDWKSLDPADQARFETRARSILHTAAAITSALYDPAATP